VFLSDNGACAEAIPEDLSVEELVNDLMIARSHTRKGEEVRFGNSPEIMPGPEDTYQSYGRAWANLSNTPFRLYKHWAHEGGVSTPLILHWPGGITTPGSIRHTPAQLPDIMATILEIARAEYPEEYEGNTIAPLEGRSLAPMFSGNELPHAPLFWEHEGNAAVRFGNWKLVREYPGPWELYDMEADRTETHNIAERHPDRVADLSARYDAWAQRCGVIPREKILEMMKLQPGKAFWEDE